jgi:hypothetical protein
VGSVAIDNEFLQVQVIFPVIPPMIPAPGVWEQTVFLYMFQALCAHYQEVKTVLYNIWHHHNFDLPMINT